MSKTNCDNSKMNGYLKKGSIKTKTLSVLVILTMCLTSCEALPTAAVVHSRQNRNHAKRETISMGASSNEQLSGDLPWWHRPCNYTLPETPPCARHKPNCQKAKTIGINRLKYVVNYTLTYFNMINDTWINKEYQGMKAMTKTHHKSWRLKPRHDIFKNAVEKGLKRDDIIKSMIPKLHADIQMFGLIFENLQNLKVNTESADFNADYRIGNISALTYRLKSLLCEVEMQLKKASIPIPDRIRRDSFSEVLKRNWSWIQARWVAEPDLTTTNSLDSGMFYAYECLLKDWKKILTDIRQYKKFRHGHHRVSNESTAPNPRPRGRRRRNKGRKKSQ